MRIAFYAPLKAPTHPAPSGDRRMARQLVSALRFAGHTVDVASTFRSFDGNPARQDAVRGTAEAEADRIVRDYRARSGSRRPEVWFTYHLYYKAPDWIGPRVSRALGLGYVVAEASHAPKRANGPWASGHEAVANALGTADSVLALVERDIPCVLPLLRAEAELFRLPPFLDPVADIGDADRSSRRAALVERHALDGAKNWLLAVAMMRRGDKLRSYRLLSRALATLPGDDWQLVIVGDGAARADVRAEFSRLGSAGRGGCVAWLGQLAAPELRHVYAACDVLVWPGVNEAYGMTFLEAQAAGLPTVAGDAGGVREVIRDGETGILVDAGDHEAFSRAVRGLLDDPVRRREMGRRGREFIRDERSLIGASGIIDRAVAHAAKARHGAARRAS